MLRWKERTYSFGVVTRQLWTPKAVAEAMDEARRVVVPTGAYPLILVPYLNEERLLALEAQEVSGIDLCGNGFIVVPGELFILRKGSPNRFLRRQGLIKNVYRESSSIVARTFLLKPEFGSVHEVLTEIQEREGKVALATVSKVCKSLEEDLVIERAGTEASRSDLESRRLGKKRGQRLSRRGWWPLGRRARLIQPEKLLDLLARNYAPPQVRRMFRGKSALAAKVLRKRLEALETENGIKVVLTGESSVEAYAVMAREPMQSFYCTDIEGVIQSLGSDLRETARFANVTLLETRENFVYFDRRPGLIASPIQSYLELLTGDKRERETADQLRRVILGPLGRDAAGE
jgi:hypothetical protein